MLMGKHEELGTRNLDISSEKLVSVACEQVEILRETCT